MEASGPPVFVLCVLQKPNDVPYRFAATGLRVFSFEETLYHAYTYWKQSADEFLSDELIAWVNDVLGLSYLASKMNTLAHETSFSRRMMGFLRITPYFGEADLQRLDSELRQWEKRREWEKLKERADYFVTKGEPDKATPLYRRALGYEENDATLHNLAVACLQMNKPREGYERASRAMELNPGHAGIRMCAIEAAIHAGRIDTARAWLDEAAPDDPDVFYLRGLLALNTHEYIKAVDYLNEAIRLAPNEPPYRYLLADAYIKIRRYETALSTMDHVAVKDAPFYEKLAECHAAAGQTGAAVKAMQKALFMNGAGAGLWVKLAAYHRLDYDLTQAEGAVTRALLIDPENERAKLENARIKKSLGRTREYQAILHDLLACLRKKYREALP